MSELTLSVGPNAVPNGDKELTVPRLPTAATRRRGDNRWRRRFSATRLAATNDGDFRPFRIY